MYISFLLSWNNILSFIFTCICSYAFMFIAIEMEFFKERTREELVHKKHTNGICTSGGLMFITAMLFSINIAQSQVLIGFSYLIVASFIVFFKKRILSLWFIPLLVVLFCLINYENMQDIFNNHYFLIGFSVFLGMLIGILDDYKKFSKGHGLSEWFLVFFQSIIGLIPVLYNYFNDMTYFHLFKYKIQTGVFYIPIAVFIFNCTVNSVNLTDGLNGGLSVPSIFVLLFFMGHYLKSAFFSCDAFLIVSDQTYCIYSFLMIATLIPFIFLNLSNKMFMGNTGSTCIGVFIATMAILMKTELLLPIYGCLFVIEALSVIIQRFYYKRYKKRLLLFSPIHHHFELLGWTNSKIVKHMTLITFIGVTISLCLV